MDRPTHNTEDALPPAIVGDPSLDPPSTKEQEERDLSKVLLRHIEKLRARKGGHRTFKIDKETLDCHRSTTGRTPQKNPVCHIYFMAYAASFRASIDAGSTTFLGSSALTCEWARM